MELLEVGKTYRVEVNTEEDAKWRFPRWVNEHNRYIFDKEGIYSHQYIQTPLKVKVEKITTLGIWVVLYVGGEVEPRSGLMQLHWKDILTIEVEQ